VALAKAAAPIVAEAKQRAPSRKPRGFVGPMPGGTGAGGNLKKSIYAYRNRASTRTYESRFIGVRGKAFYWKFIEFGRGIVRASKKGDAGVKVVGTPQKGWFGKEVRAVPAKPFMRPAFEEHKLQAIQIYAAALKPGIEKVAAQGMRRSLKRITKKITGL
jgi:HK97 gp10 family phage protein